MTSRYDWPKLGVYLALFGFSVLCYGLVYVVVRGLFS